MKRVLAIADDLSGAAEIGGIGQRYALPTRSFREPPRSCEPGLTVIDTNSRSLSPADAAESVRSFVSGVRADEFDLIYKKTDSVLRGPIAAEIEALQAHFNLPAALLLAQNPSRGRTIDQGQYRINGVPLHQTPFADDPEHPARSSDARELMGNSTIPICDACDAQGVRQWARQTRGGTLPAGGADFFEAILQDRGLIATRTFENILPPGPTLFVCGSASAYSRELIALARSRGVPVNPAGSDPAQIPRAMIAIDRPLDRTPGAAQRLQQSLADDVAATLQKTRVANLLVEGGSTASAVCRRMGWNQFEVCGELAVGVVRLRAIREGEAPAEPRSVSASASARQEPRPPGPSMNLVIKPGSYPWPESVWKEN